MVAGEDGVDAVVAADAAFEGGGDVVRWGTGGFVVAHGGGLKGMVGGKC